MNLKELSQTLPLVVRTASAPLTTEITGGYSSDLLSCVMGKAKAGNVWVTLQSHPNVVAVASLLNLAGVIITEGAEPDPATLQKAEQEGVAIVTTSLTTFALVGRLYGLGVDGTD